MIKKLFLLVSVICVGQVLNAIGQTNSDNFFIKNVYVDLEADTRYVRKLADKTVSMYWQRKSNYEEIECFRSELMKTGLFENFQTKLDKLDETDKYNLTVIVNYQSSNPTYRIGKIKLVGFVGIDEAKFNSILVKNEISEKLISLKTDFPVFENQITQAIQESYIEKIPKEKPSKPWVEIQLKTNGELDVLVMPSFKGCSEFSKS